MRLGPLVAVVAPCVSAAVAGAATQPTESARIARLCRLGLAGAERSVAVFWLPQCGADGAAAWFHKGSGGGARAAN